MTDLSIEKTQPDELDYSTAVTKTADEVRRLLRSAPPIIRHLTSHLAKAPGKMIRAHTLLACALKGNGLLSSDAVKAAAAVELLHLATLIHDDIIDDAAKRRGIDALHKKFGDKAAVLCGDWLFCTALDFVSTVGIPERRNDTVDRSLTKYLTEVCLGEMRQDQNNGNFRLSEREYFRIIGGKTAALFEACDVAGFLFSDEPDSSKELYAQLGNAVGLIFQLSDDCADYEAAERIAKKPVLSDYSGGVITLPLIHALKKDPALAQGIALGMAPAALKDAVLAAGGLEYTHAKIDGLYKKAMTMLKSLNIGADKTKLLTALLRKASGKTA